MKKTFSTYLSFLYLLGFIFLVGCGDKDPSIPSVFVAGQDYDTVSLNRDIPTVWINNTIKKLEDGGLSNFPKAIDVDENGNYYTTGYANGGSRWIGKVWKNDKLLYELSDDYSVGWGIDVVNSDVYVAGHRYDQVALKHYAFVNKNGTTTFLTDGTNQAEAFDVKVSGSDVYVAGYDGNQARVWKNGQALNLNNSANYRIKSIAISGTDVYAVGECNCFSNVILRYWKNGEETDLTEETSYAFGYDIEVSGNDVYVAGVERFDGIYIAKLWKNGVPTNLTGGTKNAWAYSIAINGADVYVAGTERSSNDIYNYAIVWKNGTPIKLGSRRSIAFGVAVK
jgi:hypothetical protein